MEMSSPWAASRGKLPSFNSETEFGLKLPTTKTMKDQSTMSSGHRLPTGANFFRLEATAQLLFSKWRRTTGSALVSSLTNAQWLLFRFGLLLLTNQENRDQDILSLPLQPRITQSGSGGIQTRLPRRSLTRRHVSISSRLPSRFTKKQYDVCFGKKDGLNRLLLNIASSPAQTYLIINSGRFSKANLFPRQRTERNCSYLPVRGPSVSHLPVPHWQPADCFSGRRRGDHLSLRGRGGLEPVEVSGRAQMICRFV